MTNVTIFEDSERGGVLELVHGIGAINRKYLAGSYVFDTSINGAARPQILASTPGIRKIVFEVTSPPYEWIDLNLRKSGEWSLPRDMTLELVIEAANMIGDGDRVVIYALTATSNGAVLAAMIMNEILGGMYDPIEFVRFTLGEKAVETKAQAEIIYNYMDVSSDLRTSHGFYDNSARNAAKTNGTGVQKQLPPPVDSKWKCKKCNKVYTADEAKKFSSTELLRDCADPECTGVCEPFYPPKSTSLVGNRTSEYKSEEAALWVCGTCFCEYKYDDLQTVFFGTNQNEDWGKCPTEGCDGKCKHAVVNFSEVREDVL